MAVGKLGPWTFALSIILSVIGLNNADLMPQYNQPNKENNFGAHSLPNSRSIPVHKRKLLAVFNKDTDSSSNKENIFPKEQLNSDYKNDMLENSIKDFDYTSLTNRNSDDGSKIMFDNHKNQRKHGQKHHHKRYHHHSKDLLKKKHYQPRVFNSSRKHGSKSKHKVSTIKEASQKVKKPAKSNEYSTHKSSLKRKKKSRNDYTTQNLKKSKLNGLKYRSFHDDSPKRLSQSKHPRKHKHHGRGVQKKSAKRYHHENTSKLYKKLKQKLFDEKETHPSLYRFLKRLIDRADKKYHRDKLSKKLHRKYANMKLPDHAMVAIDAFVENETEDPAIFNKETTIMSNENEYTINADQTTLDSTS